jgi:hypothetical protein
LCAALASISGAGAHDSEKARHCFNPGSCSIGDPRATCNGVWAREATAARDRGKSCNGESEQNVKCCPHTAKAHAMSVRLNRDEG